MKNILICTTVCVFFFLSCNMALSEMELNFTPIEYSIAFNKNFSSYNKPQVQDVNGDSYLDIIIGNQIFINNKNLGFNDPLIFSFADAGLSDESQCCIGDFNGDGRLDFAFPSKVGPVFYINKDNQLWEPKQLVEFGNMPCTYIVSSDINKDLIPDFILFYSREIQVWLCDNTGTYTLRQSLAGFFDWPRKVLMADLNKDSCMDIVVESISFQYFISNGASDGTFTEKSSFNSMLNRDLAANFHFIDYNNDGFLDVILSGTTGGNNFAKYQNDNFTVLPAPNLIYPAPVDLDQDGSMDLVGYKMSKDISILEDNPFIISVVLNKKNGTEWQQRDLYKKTDPLFSVHAVDWNHDGKSDILLLNPQKVTLLLNQSSIKEPGRQPATIRVPEDSITINDAISKSIDGDVIQIAPGNYQDYFVIKDKKITLEGKDQRFEPILSSSTQYYSPVVWINQSDVTLRNITITGFQGEGVVAENANLSITNCSISGASAIHYMPYGDYIDIPSKSAVKIVNCLDKNISIKNSSISCPSSIDSVTTDGCSISIENSANTKLAFDNTNVDGSHAGIFRSRWANLYEPKAGLFIKNSTDIAVTFQQSAIMGGRGYSAFTENIYCTRNYKPCKGAPGVLVDHSSVEIHDGLLIGGTGGDGGENAEYDVYRNKIRSFIVDAAEGGMALWAVNFSAITLYNSTLHAGQGGYPDNKDGKPYEIDSSSSIQILSDSPVQHWEVY